MNTARAYQRSHAPAIAAVPCTTMTAVVQQPQRLSVIIPTLSEEATIGGAVRSAFAAGAHEVLVSDGGSRDRTVELAAAAGRTSRPARRAVARS